MPRLSGIEELGLRLLVLVEFDGVPPMLPLPIGPVDVDGICEPLGVVGVLLDPVDVVGGVSLPVVPGVPTREPVVPPAPVVPELRRLVSPLPLEQFAAYVKEQTTWWTTEIKAAGIEPE